MGGAIRYVVVALVAAAVALMASHYTQVWMADHRADGGELHALVHERLDLDPQQQAAIERLEQQFAQRRQVLDGQMRATNADLAAAMASEHQFGPRVADAVDRSHMAMGQLQKATLAHVFAMRAVLNPAQAAKFDREIVRVLTAPQAR
jgi:Spy/CpxP family protein refolding chaperone